MTQSDLHFKQLVWLQSENGLQVAEMEARKPVGRLDQNSGAADGHRKTAENNPEHVGFEVTVRHPSGNVLEQWEIWKIGETLGCAY